ncbi:hypothetical protein Tco_0219201 [Tanacetum coccineum]
MAIKLVPDVDPILKPELTGESSRRKIPKSPWGSPIPIGDGDGDVNRFPDGDGDGDGDEAEKRGWGWYGCMGFVYKECALEPEQSQAAFKL